VFSYQCAYRFILIFVLAISITRLMNEILLNYLTIDITEQRSLLAVKPLQLVLKWPCWPSVYTGFVQTVKYCFPGLSRTCKDQIPGFSRTHNTRFQRLSGTNSVHKHGCIRSKKCTYQISYQCNCITVNKPKCNN